MREWLALGMMTMGGLIAAIAPIGGYVALFRGFHEQRVLAADKAKRDVALIQYLYTSLLFALTAAGGLVLLLLGLVVGFGLTWWAPALAGGILVGTFLAANYTRWHLVRLHGR